MYKVGQIITIKDRGKYKIVDAPTGCTSCEYVKNDIDLEPCETCCRICRTMGKSNIKLHKMFEGDLDSYLKEMEECGNLDS